MSPSQKTVHLKLLMLFARVVLKLVFHACSGREKCAVNYVLRPQESSRSMLSESFSLISLWCPRVPLGFLIVLCGCHCSFLVLLAHYLISEPTVIVWDVHKPSHCTPVITTHSLCHVLCGNMPCGTGNNQTLILAERVTDVLFFYCLWGSFRSSERAT